jgi:hypothetical protein
VVVVVVVVCGGVVVPSVAPELGDDVLLQFVDPHRPDELEPPWPLLVCGLPLGLRVTPLPLPLEPPLVRPCELELPPLVLPPGAWPGVLRPPLPWPPPSCGVPELPAGAVGGCAVVCVWPLPRPVPPA